MKSESAEDRDEALFFFDQTVRASGPRSCPANQKCRLLGVTARMGERSGMFPDRGASALP